MSLRRRSSPDRAVSSALSEPPGSAAGIRWDLGDLYQAVDDPAIARHQAEALAGARAFEGEYRGRVAALSPGSLAEALARLEALTALAARPLIYAQLRFAGDTSAPRHGALLQAAREKRTEVMRHLLFFDLEWLAVPEEEARATLADPALATYRHHLERLRMGKPFTLSEPEEKILADKADTGEHAFQRLFEEVVGALTCRVAAPEGERTLSLQEALSLLHLPERPLRKAGAEAITAALQGAERILVFIFNTLVREHAENDRLRGRPHPMAARNLDNEIEQAGVEALLEACDGALPLVSRYYRLKRRLLGYPRLYDYDRYAPIGGDLPACGYEDARRIVLEAYRAFSPTMAEIAEKFFASRWIDAELRPGKTDGAFSASTVPELHPYILLNYTDTLRDVMTLAHELGHGIHQYLARPRGFYLADTPLTVAETASVFGEMLTFHSLMAGQDDPRTRLALLCGKLEDLILTVFRQAALTRFEQSLHQARRSEGELSAAAMGALWLEANQTMFGDSVEMTEGYRCWWSYISHFVHTPFYCYAYSFGELLALALFRRYEQEGAGFVPEYLKLLEAGGSEAPEALLRPLGMDVADPGFWGLGLAVLEELVEQAEKLAESLGPRERHGDG